MGRQLVMAGRVLAWIGGAAIGLASCSDDKADSPPMSSDPNMTAAGAGGEAPTQPPQSPEAGAGGMSTSRGPRAGASPAPTAGSSGTGASGTSSSGTGGSSGMPATPSAGAGSGGMPAAMSGTGGMAPPAAGAGAPDGDPAKPMVAVPNVPCGAPNVTIQGAPAGNMVKITNRDVFVAYPCAHEGADVTFYLAIHGTLQAGQKIPFTLTNFPIHKKADSDNFIVVAPQAIGTQWGNGDNNQDLPHLYDVINWVYDTFGEKFNIRGMWASGGSWGSAYLYTFACDPMLEERLTGIRMIVGRGCPPCSSRLSCIVGEQELEEGGGMMLSDAQKQMKIMAANIDTYATMHGCDARTGPTNLGPVRAWTWPNCDKGWAHSYYLGPGEHADRWDDPMYVDHMTAEMKATDR